MLVAYKPKDKFLNAGSCFSLFNQVTFQVL
jgi:hypothetical protein